ncbi:TapB family protein [Spirosoma gilvum]
MKTLVFSLLLTLSVFANAKAQECLGMSFKSGMSFELSHFNAKEKLIGKVAYQVKDVHQESGSTVVDITALFEDEKGKQRPPYTIRYTCTGNELIADMSGMLQSMQANMKDMEMRIKSNQLIYPTKLSVGQKLSDGKMEAEMVNSGAVMMNMAMTMTNRQVEGKESITTPAGTFDTYKITSDVSFENRAMGIPIRNSMRVVSYRTDNRIFDIKSETYNKNGKLLGTSLLTKAN